MSRRLVNRAGNSAASSSHSRTATTTTTLPDYEPLAFPLNDTARRALGDLSNNRGTSEYEKHMADAVRLLGASTSDLHERLRARHQRLAALHSKREERNAEKSAEEERLEEHTEELEREANQLTELSEAAVRAVIDQRVELEDAAAVLRDLYTSAATEHPSTAPQDLMDGLDDEEPPSVPSTLDSYRERRAEKLAEYNQMPVRERYGRNNDYAGFKKLWHDAAVGEDGPPLPDASRWFSRDGLPVMTLPGAGGVADADEDMSDEEVAVARETISMKCPLTLVLMVEPYSNHKCKHTFEKDAIVGYLSSGQAMQCPQTGCSETFSRARFSQDFYLDQAMKRRIERAKQAQDNAEMDEDEDEDDMNDRSLVQGREREIRRPKRERT